MAKSLKSAFAVAAASVALLSGCAGVPGASYGNTERQKDGTWSETRVDNRGVVLGGGDRAGSTRTTVNGRDTCVDTRGKGSGSKVCLPTAGVAGAIGGVIRMFTGPGQQ